MQAVSTRPPKRQTDLLRCLSHIQRAPLLRAKKMNANSGARRGTAMGALPRRELVDRFMRVPRAFGPKVLRNGSLLYDSDRGGYPKPYQQATPESEPELLQLGELPLLSIGQTSNDGILVRHDQFGNEHWQLSIVESEGRLRTLTHDPAAIFQGVLIHPDRARAGIAYNPGGQDDFVLGLIDLSTGVIKDWARPEEVGPGQLGARTVRPAA